MAKAKKRAIPAKRGTKKPTTRPAAPKPKRIPQLPPAQSPANQPSELVPMTPEHQGKIGYRESEVQAVETGTYGYVERPKGERFRVGVVGEGPLPPWVRAV